MLKKVLVVFLASVSLAFGQAKKNLEYSGFFDTYYFRGPWSFTAGGSVALYNGDLAEFTKGNKVQPSFNLGVAYKPIPKVQVGLQYSFINLGANDVENRGLSFSGKIHEVSLFGKYYIIEDIVRRHSQFINKKPKLVKPYVSLAIAPVLYNATLSNSNDTTSISGNGTTIVLPVGGGFQFDVSRRVAVILDMNYRFAFTDVFDAYSPEQSTANDSYATVGLTVQYSPWAPRLKKKKFKSKKAGEGVASPSGGGAGTSEGSEPASNEGAAGTSTGEEQEASGEEDTSDEGVTEEESTGEEEVQDEQGSSDEYSEEESGSEDEYTEDEYSEEEESSEESGEEEYYNEGDGW